MADLAQYQRVGWRNKKAWSLVRRAKPLLLERRGRLYFVQGGVTATPIDADGKTVGPAVKAVTLLDPAKRPAGR